MKKIVALFFVLLHALAFNVHIDAAATAVTPVEHALGGLREKTGHLQGALVRANNQLDYLKQQMLYMSGKGPKPVMRTSVGVGAAAPTGTASARAAAGTGGAAAATRMGDSTGGSKSPDHMGATHAAAAGTATVLTAAQRLREDSRFASKESVNTFLESLGTYRPSLYEVEKKFADLFSPAVTTDTLVAEIKTILHEKGSNSVYYKNQSQFLFYALKNAFSTAMEQVINKDFLLILFIEGEYYFIAPHTWIYTFLHLDTYIVTRRYKINPGLGTEVTLPAAGTLADLFRLSDEEHLRAAALIYQSRDMYSFNKMDKWKDLSSTAEKMYGNFFNASRDTFFEAGFLTKSLREDYGRQFNQFLVAITNHILNVLMKKRGTSRYPYEPSVEEYNFIDHVLGILYKLWMVNSNSNHEIFSYRDIITTHDAAHSFLEKFDCTAGNTIPIINPEEIAAIREKHTIEKQEAEAAAAAARAARIEGIRVQKALDAAREASQQALDGANLSLKTATEYASNHPHSKTIKKLQEKVGKEAAKAAAANQEAIDSAKESVVEAAAQRTIAAALEAGRLVGEMPGDVEAAKIKAQEDINRLIRGRLARIKAAKMRKYQQDNEAAETIQHAIRGHVARKRFTKFRKGMVKLQAAVRRHQARKRRDDAARFIQRLERGRQGRNRAREAREDRAVRTMQRVARGRAGRREAARKRRERDENNAAKTIQQAIRGHQARTELTKRRNQRDAATKIQSVVRSRRAQKELSRQRKAADVIRSAAHRKLDRKRFVEKKNAATRIKKNWKKTRSNKKLNKLQKTVRDAQRQDSAAQTVQRAARSRQARNELKKRRKAKEREERSAKQIQAAYRGHRDRKKLRELRLAEAEARALEEARAREESIKIDEARGRAATALKRVLAAYEAATKLAAEHSEIDFIKISMNRTMEKLLATAKETNTAISSATILTEAKNYEQRLVGLAHRAEKILADMRSETEKAPEARKVVTVRELTSNTGHGIAILKAVKEATKEILSILHKFDPNANGVKKRIFFRDNGSNLYKHLRTLEKYKGDIILSGNYTNKSNEVKLDEEQKAQYDATLARAEAIISTFKDQTTLPEHIQKVRNLFFETE